MKFKAEGILLAASISLMIATNAIGDNKNQNWWSEISGDIGYQKTNFWYPDQKNFGLTSADIRGGYRFRVSEQVFVDPYIEATLLTDLLGAEHNKFYWSKRKI